jgi:DNA-binding PadR family transcriptional regulator
MKIGKYNRQIKDFAVRHRMKPQDVKILLLLNENMWMSYPDIRYYIALSNQRIFTSMQGLLDAKYISLARTPNGKKGITKMYSIERKGRIVAERFLSILNDE